MDKPISADDIKIFIPSSQYIFRVQHRTLEGDCQYDHGPRLIKLNSFRIDRYPVTNKRFSDFLKETGYMPEDASNFLKHWVNGAYLPGLENHPVVWVSQSDARAYAGWAGGRLPKDGEWQYAACGPDKFKWPWGNEFDENRCNSYEASTTMVDKYPHGASPFGCMDMCGNVWEWTDETIDDGFHIFALIRGGSYYKGNDRWHVDGGPKPNDFHWKFQLLNEGMNRCGTIGFRCVTDGDGK